MVPAQVVLVPTYTGRLGATIASQCPTGLESQWPEGACTPQTSLVDEVRDQAGKFTKLPFERKFRQRLQMYAHLWILPTTFVV